MSLKKVVSTSFSTLLLVLVVSSIIIFAGCLTQNGEEGGGAIGGGNVWLRMEPVQCSMNEWEQWNKAAEYATEEELLKAYYLSEKGVEIQQIKIISDEDAAVCMACSCPRGDAIYALVPLEHSQKMVNSGWEMVGEVPE